MNIKLYKMVSGSLVVSQCVCVQNNFVIDKSFSTIEINVTYLYLCICLRCTYFLTILPFGSQGCGNHTTWVFHSQCLRRIIYLRLHLLFLHDNMYFLYTNVFKFNFLFILSPLICFVLMPNWQPFVHRLSFISSVHKEIANILNIL